MNLLLVNHYAGSPAWGMEYRPYHLAREWVRAGHRVHIVAASHSHVRSQQPAPGRHLLDGITVDVLPTPAYQGNGVGRVANIGVFLARLWARADALAQEIEPDAVIASSTYPMDVWVARRIARAAHAKLVYEVHDLWPLSLIELAGMSPRHPWVRLCGLAERQAYRDADRVVSMLPKVHEHMAARGLDLQRLHIVPNGIDTTASDAPEPLRADVAQAIAAQRSAGRAVLGYAGSMGLPNALDTLLDAATLLRGEPLAMVLVGSGHEQPRLAQRVAAEGLAGRVALLPPIPKAQVPSFLAQVDAAYIGWQRQPLYRFGIAPNKLMDYLLAGVPVLHSVKAGNDPVADAGCGLTVAPEDPAAVADGLRQLLALPAAERQAMGQRGRAYVQAHHAWPVLAQRFIEALQ